MHKFSSILKTVGGGEGDRCVYPTRLDTYGSGCQHDCSYCYAKSLLSFRGLWNPEQPHVASRKEIYSVLRNLPRGSVVRLGGMTDCFQPIERVYQNTLRLIKVLNKKDVGYLIVTKSDLVADDRYIAAMDKDLAHIQITVTCTDDERAKTYEKACAPSKRIKAIEKLQEQGFDVALRLSPYINGFIDFNIINNVRCDKIQVEFLRVNHWIKRWFNIDYSPYTLSYGGYDHLSLASKKQILNRINGFKQISVCEDVPEHYEYWKMNVNANKDDCCNLRRKE